MVDGETESLLGLKDALALGIVQFNVEGQTRAEAEEVRQLFDMPRQVPGPGVISGGQTQEEIDLLMTELVKPYEQVFQGIGVAKVEPVHIEVDSSVKPVQQKRRPIAINYLDRFRDHIEELHRAGVVSGPLTSESARG